jgi:hypothetical protein
MHPFVDSDAGRVRTPGGAADTPDRDSVTEP